MNLLKKLYYLSCSGIPIKALKKISSTTIFPYHHLVSNEDVLHIKHLYSYKNVKQFTTDLDYLLKHFKPIGVDKLIEYINTNNTLPQNSFLLTFDDGFREIYDVVAPILEAKGVPSIFFVNPAFIDNYELFYRGKISLLINELIKNKNNKAIIYEFGKALNLQNPSTDEIVKIFRLNTEVDKSILDELAAKISLSFEEYLKTTRPFLTLEQLHSLKNKGFTIGAHSWDHPYYRQLNLQQQLEQTFSSCEYVKEKLHTNNVTFSFPYSDEGLGQNLFDEIKKNKIDLLFGIQNQKDELNNKMIHRFNAERPEVPINRLLKGILSYTIIQKRLNRNQVHRN